MGARGSQTKEEKDEQDKSAVYDPSLIYYDSNGNLRIGSHERDRAAELNRVVAADDPEDAPDKVWYIIDSSWVKAWLAFVHYDQTSPAPGPVLNSGLLRYDFDSKLWVPAEGLQAATRATEGNYRRINKEVWDVYADLYEGSGPVITVSVAPYDDIANWNVDQDFLPPPEVKRSKIKKPPQPTILDEGVSEAKNDEEVISPVDDKKVLNTPLLGREVMEDDKVSQEHRQSLGFFFGSAPNTRAPEVQMKEAEAEGRPSLGKDKERLTKAEKLLFGME